MGDATLDFLGAAREFRAVLREEDVPEREFARRVRNALARVYLAGALLGSPGAPETDDRPLDATRDRAESQELQARLEARFGEHDIFVDVYDPSRLMDEDVAPIEHSLSWGLVEIDEDLTDAIAWLDEGLPDALWDVRWAVENHWGQHAVACLRPLHQLVTSNAV
jgi:hypothetical protein